jgi:hypothetical protein
MGARETDHGAGGPGGAPGIPEPVPAEPYRLVPRIVLFLTLMIFATVFANQITRFTVRAMPSLVASEGLAEALCGPGARLGYDTRTREELKADGRTRRRGLDEWLLCRGADGTEMRGAGQRATWILTIPGALLLVWPAAMLAFRRRAPPRFATVRTRPRPMSWSDRAIVIGCVTLIAATAAFAWAAAATQYGRAVIDENPIVGAYLCGPDLTSRLVDPFSRRRRIGCVDETGAEPDGPSNWAMTRLVLPVFLLVWVPLVWLSMQMRSVSRRVRLPPPRR